MASYDGSIMIETKVDSSGLKKGMTSINKQANTMKTSFAGIGKAVAVAFATKVLVDFGKQAVSLASDLQEVQNVVDVAFGDMANKIEEFAKTSIQTMGISELTAKRTASTYMSMGKGMGIATEASFNMALSLTQLSADMASFYNISQERADIALKAVYTGETEVLKQYGIVMTEVNLQQYALSQGITKSLDDMNQQEKTLLRYNYILQQTQQAQGDFSRTSGSWANQTKILSEQWKQFMGIIGSGLIKVLTPLVTILNAIVSGLINFANAIASVFGGQKVDAQQTADAIGSSVENQEALTEATKKTNKEAKKMTATFDEIQKLQSQTTENGGTNGMGVISASQVQIKDVEKVEGIRKWLQDTTIFEDLKTIFTEIKKTIEPVIESIKVFITWLGKIVLEQANLEVKWFFKDLEDSIGFVADVIRGDFDSAWQHLKDLFINNRIDKTTEQFELFKQKILDVADVIKERYSKENMDKAFFNIGASFGSAIAKILEWDTKLDTWIEDNIKPLFTKEKWVEIFSNIAKSMKAIMEDVLSWFTKERWMEAGKNLYNGLASNINKAIDGIQNLINSAIDFFNRIIDGYNSIADVNPLMKSINPIDPINLSKYKIPQLAQGAVIPPNKEFMAILGDQKQGVNIETPLATMIEAFKQAQSQQTGEIVADITLDIDGEKLYNQQQRIQLRRGTRLVTGGAF